MANDDHRSEQIDLKRLKADLPKRWKCLLAANAVLTALVLLTMTSTYLVRGGDTLVQGGTGLIRSMQGLLEAVPPVTKAFAEAAHGVPDVTEDITSAPGNVEDGNTSDRTKAYTKTVDVCLHPTRADARLVPGSAHFVAEVLTPEAGFSEIPSPQDSYCVRLVASTSAKERLARVMGRIHAKQYYPGSAKG
ncbi:hypothetical protein [Methylobacterium brachythecii]|uniref:Uncharacterized protein n=1 Tax=Methylobacterium brachythecii TaxID=1176177 RepID=A0A7W6F9M5_9HYPH|nr:hypothetical protein [Methylobacterium brachythecii]MBB3905675.1 hypothetical protein [Methylobacterium brachythecii]GLS46947.1 hypothetical protein GCM10007884_49470 [Methylobacterium brachythecii]